VRGFESAIGADRPEVSVVRFLPGETRIYQKEPFIGTIPEDAGLPRPSSQDVQEFAILDASAELIPKMGGDVIFVTTKRKITSEPLWESRKPCREDRSTRSPTTCGCSAPATPPPTASCRSLHDSGASR
jgi:iron complex transport system substrate-binding protein